MHSESTAVGMLSCPDYDGNNIGECIGKICASLSRVPSPGTKVLLKPNLVMARGHDGLACTHPLFVAAAARHFLDYGSKVTIGDSPAFGSASQVMRSCGILEALKGLDVTVVNFSPGPGVKLRSGRMITFARETFETDLLVNLPKLKAHAQLGMTLAVKNLFGLVIAWRKWLLHQSLGREVDSFLAMLVDILEAIPVDTFTLLDGIVGMQGTGPVRGHPVGSEIVAGSWNPVALDTSILEALSLKPEVNLLSRACQRRQYPGSRAADIEYPLLAAEEFNGPAFAVPEKLKPVPFSVKDALLSVVQRGRSTAATFFENDR